MTTPIRVTRERDGQLERIVLDRPKGNIIDSAMLGALTAHVQTLTADPGPRKLLLFEGAGDHFSFGAALAEHLPDQVAGFLAAFHGFFYALENLGLPTAALVRGQCLGGGCELALWSGRVFCHPGARFALPESRLGVFPPVAALALPWRIAGAKATQLILTGETVEGAAAAGLGLADHCSEDPEAALQHWFTEMLEPKSAVALRFAWRAARRPLAQSLQRDLPELEKLYLHELMAHADPLEGINAFIAKRPPHWSHA